MHSVIKLPFPAVYSSFLNLIFRKVLVNLLYSIILKNYFGKFRISKNIVFRSPEKDLFVICLYNTF